MITAGDCDLSVAVSNPERTKLLRSSFSVFMGKKDSLIVSDFTSHGEMLGRKAELARPFGVVRRV